MKSKFQLGDLVVLKEDLYLKAVVVQVDDKWVVFNAFYGDRWRKHLWRLNSEEHPEHYWKVISR